MAGQQPNLYELSGDGIQVTYSTSSIQGQPIFNYHDATHAKTFTGDQIKTEPSSIGTLVTVVINLTIDAGSTTFTLLIPQINLTPPSVANITTEGITTLHKLTIVGPSNGQSEFYTSHTLQGTASVVFF